MLNVHPGDLRKTDQNGKRLLIGSKAVFKALLLGHQGSRSSIHMVTHEMDAGPILEVSEEVPFSAKLMQVREELVSLLQNEMHLNEEQIMSMNAANLEELPSILKSKFPSQMKQVFRHCKEHQNIQKQLADWPSYIKVVKAIARGKSKLLDTECEGRLMISSEWILILDFGGQYTQLITRAVRRAGTYSEILPYNSDPDQLSSRPKGIILSGGPESVYADQAPQPSPKWLDLGIPILGICYGMQWLNHFHGGEMLHGVNHSGEYGEIEVNIDSDHALFDGIDKRIISWMSHGDSIDEKGLAQDFKIIAKTSNHVAAISSPLKKFYGVQFHPEVSHMPDGQKILVNFVRKICNCKTQWGMQDFLRQSHQYVRDTVKQRDVLSFVSGGVDSSFVTCLLSQVEGIGNVHAVYIEALMRKGELDEVKNALKKAGVKNLKIIDAKQRFIEALKDEWEPETKRKIVGNLFGDLQTEACADLNLDAATTVLAQGTLYTDLIESGKGVGNKAHNIKSHHNVGCKFIEDLKERGQVVEPNQWIFKDEVRLAAAEIGLPSEIVNRQPFPGPGLAIRIVQGREEWINQDFLNLQRKLLN